jgi:hypothetical protein
VELLALKPSTRVLCIRDFLIGLWAAMMVVVKFAYGRMRMRHRVADAAGFTKSSLGL